MPAKRTFQLFRQINETRSNRWIDIHQHMDVAILLRVTVSSPMAENDAFDAARFRIAENDRFRASPTSEVTLGPFFRDSANETY